MNRNAWFYIIKKARDSFSKHFDSRVNQDENEQIFGQLKLAFFIKKLQNYRKTPIFAQKVQWKTFSIGGKVEWYWFIRIEVSKEYSGTYQLEIYYAEFIKYWFFVLLDFDSCSVEIVVEILKYV